jgi:hypothetical protein
LPAGPLALWDRVATFRVRIAGGSLASLSDAQVLNGGNAAALCTPAGWEVLQFAHAELVDGNIYRLSRLLRGQLGSEPAMADLLPAGAAFVLLDRNLVPLARGRDALGRPIQLRVAGSNRSHDDAMAVALTVTPGDTALRPLAPVHLQARRGSDGVHVSWIRRGRIDADSWSGEVPLGEESEACTLEILSGTTVLRRIDCSVPQALYAASHEIADFGAPQPSLHLRVAQLSTAVGAGFACERVVTL